MFKLIILILGLAIGFGGGVYWSAKNPDQANKLSAAEEAQFLQAQLAVTQKIQNSLDKLEKKNATPGSSIVSSDNNNSSADVESLKAQNEKQQEALKKRINALK